MVIHIIVLPQFKMTHTRAKQQLVNFILFYWDATHCDVIEKIKPNFNWYDFRVNKTRKSIKNLIDLFQPSSRTNKTKRIGGKPVTI